MEPLSLASGTGVIGHPSAQATGTTFALGSECSIVAPPAQGERPAQRRDLDVLILSMRGSADLVGYCALYEFEDVISETLGAEIFAPTDLRTIERSRKAYKLLRYATGSARLAELLRHDGRAFRIDKELDAFFAIFNNLFEVFALSAVPGWRQRCRFAACYICEALPPELPVYLVELLKDFDHVFIGVNNSRESVANISGRPCTYLPMGVDALRFCPFPNPPLRSIDVCEIGRRSEITHAALLALAQAKGFFFYYDTVVSTPVPKKGEIISFRVRSPREHRMLLANILKRSRYFIANRAWADKQEAQNNELSSRFYEGAAAGCIMLGKPPDTADFASQFGWEDAVIRMPFDAPQVGDLIAELDADPVRSARIRQNAVTSALLRHDWAYRLRPILQVAGIAPPERLVTREATLRSLADEVRRG
jgi:hypothetical protein